MQSLLKKLKCYTMIRGSSAASKIYVNYSAPSEKIFFIFENSSVASCLELHGLPKNQFIITEEGVSLLFAKSAEHEIYHAPKC